MSTSQSNEPKPPAETSPTMPPPSTPLAAAQTVLSLLAQSSPPRDSSADAPTQTSTLDAAQTVLSILSQPSAQQENPSDAPASITPLGVAQTALSRLASPPAPREDSGDASTSPASAGAVKAMLSLLGQPSTPRVTQAPQPAPEPPQEYSMNVPRLLPSESPQRGPEPTFPAFNSASSHGARRTSTPPRETARASRSYPTPLDAPLLPRRIPNRERTVAQRLDPTITAAKAERNKAAYQAKWTGLAINIAIGLQVFFGALTTAFGAALSGKSTSVAISILGGASTLVASYLARVRGSNEPEFSLLRTKALNHFLREINAFTLDHGHEVGREWDEKINGFRLGLENMLGNRPGSVTINSEAGTNSGQDKGLGANIYPSSLLSYV
ncbi:hypothetical protein BJV78DRAFT_1227553 [Lactifluus subvellereus]|nr:hypothetical protein BJV78DRAFT_1227553 [Lactifluus subvellereus]